MYSFNKDFYIAVKRNSVIIILMGIGFLLRILAALMDPFLHPWDERFHALVARNMMNHPFTPMLRADPVTDNYDLYAWCCNHIWLHKQPLFLWQMALSMKVFGTSEWAMRFPSVLMGTLMILMLYRIALVMTKNREVAYLTALLFAFSNFQLQMISGIKGMDHNDVALGFYVLASIWAYTEYFRSPKIFWVILIGFFSGCAILNKWLIGLLVYLGWGFNLIFYSLHPFNKRKFLDYLASICICILVFAPWQYYIIHTYPDLARHEYQYNVRHITEALDGHEVTNFFYLGHLKNLFGAYLFFLIPCGVLLLYYAKSSIRPLSNAILFQIVFVFFFYSFVVKTKVDTYMFFIVPFCLIFISIALHKLYKWSKSDWVRGGLILSVIYLSLNPIEISKYLSKKNEERNNRIYNATIYRNLMNYLPDKAKIVMNMNAFEDVDVMFYNNSLTAYHFMLPESDILELEKRKTPIFVFKAHDKYTVPGYIQSYDSLNIIDLELKTFYP